MPELKPGSRWKSAVCTAEVIVVKAPGGEVDLRCGGAPIGAPGTEASGTPASDLAGGTQLGKRYVDADETIEVLCTKAGDGTLSIGETALGLKESKPLPASD